MAEEPKSENSGEAGRALCIAWCLGKAMLQNLELANIELKAAGHERLYRNKKEHAKALEAKFDTTFRGFTKYLSEKELKGFEEITEEMTSVVWDAFNKYKGGNNNA